MVFCHRSPNKQFFNKMAMEGKEKGPFKAPFVKKNLYLLF